jgi:GT2 family glycosyltransferase
VRCYGHASVSDPSNGLDWVVLTMGDRREALGAAIASIGPAITTIVANGTSDPEMPVRRTVVTETNVGVPSGRDAGVHVSSGEIIAFLDDDAVAAPGIGPAVATAFDSEPRLGAVAFRLVDDSGDTARRHVPRLGGRHAERRGEVALFLGGACAIRRTAYEDAGGYWGELFYGHEEVELAWRLIDRGWTIRYLPELAVYHPRTDIGRHAEGWRLTGRNRVMIARRTLPWPIAVVHVTAWLALGLVRAPSEHRRTYARGWRSGWREPVAHRPIRWRTVWRLTRLWRPPIL